MPDPEGLHLPIDIIIHILSYLSTSDRMSARLINQTWREASLAMKFVDQEALVFGRSRADNLNQIMDVLQHSTRPFYHFIFREVELKRSMPVWDRYGLHMKSLVLLCCDLSEKALVNILKCCHSLRVLRIDGCRECLMSGRLLEDENDIKELSETFQNLRELSLGYNRYLSDALFNRLVAICSNLESLSLIGCQISFHSGLYKKFYPQNRITLPDASNSVLTFLNALHYLKQQAYKLKHLNFGYTSIDGTTLATLSALQNLKLESLILQGCYQLTIDGIKGLTQYQTCLKVLDISFCVRITDASLLRICKNLTMLETLKIKRCRAVTDIGVQYIRLLRNLRELDISEVEQLTKNCITHGLCSRCDTDTSSNTTTRNVKEKIDSENFNFRCLDDYDMENIIQKKNLQMFSANALHLHEESIERISRCFPNLKLLELGYCFNGVTDKTIQMIFKELVHLQTLKINHCDKVSDAGLTGMGAGNHETVENIEIVHEPEVTETKLRISLRSRAEEEIVRDANRKWKVMKLCENVSRPLNLKTFSGFSLIRLKYLRELDLSGCNKITDVSLKHAFAFPELRILNLSQCQQVTHIGLDYLSKNNPAIEDLNLNQCHNVSDIGISYLAQRLHRLKRLLIQGCSQLTDHTLDSIRLYCKSLHYLDTRYCLGMTVAGVESLTHLYVDWIKHIDDIVSPENEIPPPPAPPLPSLPSLP
ncbi:F-box/LRR-repeat protein 14 isoform X1 [Hylaeus anthracinus]|uniref:F-box/LRR-repeat protein 14 isoform X1 n=2 Tax=Hylaeus volcanicus TaxID=313075 RepID=UPI0023B84CAA|nr:F-box/LRR-repeat protein 14 isoform X1 [Hylaeus volcanicus]XP_054014414.1 F-box/LRR-repeat protein 14 isoform X1 [Hylaeus anthracinus]